MNQFSLSGFIVARQNKCSGSCALRARDSMARLRRCSVGRVSFARPAKANELSIGVKRKYIVTMRKALFIDLLMANAASKNTTAPDRERYLQQSEPEAEWQCAMLRCRHPWSTLPIASKAQCVNFLPVTLGKALLPAF